MRRHPIAILALAAILSAALAACGDPTAPIDPGYVPAITTLAGTYWTDLESPENTMQFTSTLVTLGGLDDADDGNKGYWDQVGLEGQSLPYSQATDFSEEEIEPAAQVWTNEALGVGFEIFYYAASGTKPERAVVYLNGLQPREFYRQ